MDDTNHPICGLSGEDLGGIQNEWLIEVSFQHGCIISLNRMMIQQS